MRKALISDEHRLIIYRAPKVGAMTTLHWLVRGLLKLRPRDLPPRASAVAYAQKNGHLIHGNAILAERPGYRAIAIKRDPMDRAVSAYVNKFVIGRQFLTSFDQLGVSAQQLYCDIRRVDRERAAADYRGISFVEFLEHIAEAVEGRNGGEPLLNPHWNTQVSFAWARRNAVIDETYDLSQLNEALEALSRQFGVTFAPRVRNATRYARTPISDDVTNEPSLDLAFEEIAPGPEALRTPRTTELVARAYAIDYETFGYRPPLSPSGYSPDDRRREHPVAPYSRPPQTDIGPASDGAA